MQIPETLQVIAIGAELFSGELKSQNVELVQLDWAPPGSDYEQHILAVVETLEDDRGPEEDAPRHSTA